MGQLFNENTLFRLCLVVGMASAFFLIQAPPERPIWERVADPSIEDVLDGVKKGRDLRSIAEDFLK
jgi:hypothetical protein